MQKQNDFQRNLAYGRPNDWQCGAGGRYLHICEDGLVHWCAQQRGHPGVPLAEYTTGDVLRESPRTSSKNCSSWGHVARDGLRPSATPTRLPRVQ